MHLVGHNQAHAVKCQAAESRMHYTIKTHRHILLHLLTQTHIVL